ncbi:MAG: LicD family protein [Turicibacter sp.]|nr:LicD family protein [Turicibacter sp.]
MQKISIIVPVYNVEPFLRKCVKSLTAQTYTNLEIILIDDGSPDNSGRICDDLAADDSRIRVIHTENQGVSAARNTGLDHATGDFITFVDPDDYASPDMIEYLYSAMAEHSACMVSCDFYRLQKGKIKNPPHRYIMELDGIDAIKETILRAQNHMWGRLFKRELWKNRRFEKGRKLGEDLVALYKVFEACNKIILLPEPKYYYRIHANGVTSTKTVENFFWIIDSRIQRHNDLEKYPQFKEDLVKNMLGKCYASIRAIYKNRKDIYHYPEITTRIKQFFKENWNYIQAMDSVNRLNLTRLEYFLDFSTLKLYKAYHLNRLAIILRKMKKRHRQRIKKLHKRMVRFFFKNLSKERPLMVDISEFSKNDLIKLQKLRLAQLDLLDELVRVCKKHNLSYYLYGGTLLGAVRHGGFIPWDDDIDLAMPRADFDKLGEIAAAELGERFFYQSCYIEKDFPYLFSKIRLNNTHVEEPYMREWNIHKGIYIDIMPLDTFPPNEKRGLRWLEKLIWLNKIQARDRPITLRPNKQITHKIYRLFPKEVTYNKIKRLIIKMNSYKNQSQKLCSPASHYRPIKKLVFQKDWFAANVTIAFEDREYNTFSGWNEYLIQVYGEKYMQLPPPEKRVNHFSFFDVKFDESEEISLGNKE